MSIKKRQSWRPPGVPVHVGGPLDRKGNAHLSGPMRCAHRAGAPFILPLLLLIAGSATALVPRGEHVPEPIDLDALAFIAGTWQGMVNGEFVEEVWSAPHAGAMIGMFRWLRDDGTPRVYEILTISLEGDDVLLRLRHFSGTMVAWEERDAPIVMRLEDVAKYRAAFVNTTEDGRLERYIFRLAGEDTLDIDIVFREGSGADPLHFRLTRAS